MKKTFRIISIILSFLALLSPSFAAVTADDLTLINSISLNSNSFDLRTSKDKLEITISPQSNIKSIRALIRRKDIFSKNKKITSKRGLAQDDGSIKITIPLKKNTPSGIWDLNIIARTLDNRKLIFLSDDLEKLSTNPSITIISNKDNLAPQILDIDFTETLNLEEENPSVLLDITTFDVSNSSTVKAQFAKKKSKKNPKKKTSIQSSESSISSIQAQHLFDFSFSKASELGNWFLKILVKDSKGNKRRYSNKALSKLALKNKLTVISQAITSDDEDGGNTSSNSGGSTNSNTVTPNTDTADDDESPDPSNEETLIQAPPIPNNPGASALDDLSFFFEGDNPLQKDIDPSVIDPKHQTIIRGRLFDTDGKPIQGVELTVLNHPELGRTFSLINGEYNFVVNGGRSYTLNFYIPGCLPVQRTIKVPSKDFYVVEEIRLTHISSEAHLVGFGSDSSQVIVSEMEEDADGERNATVIFPAGVHAQMEMDDGKMMDLDTGHFRITEYTVGEEGEMAMPGDLPGTSGYTYAVELSFDEAIENHSETVVFDKPIPLYVMNFLEFPVGETVPVGYYDRKKAAWIAADNGIVIKILEIINGKAVVSVSADESPATQDQLNEHGFTQEELVKLAQTHQEGETLWRALLTHFSPWDLNWPFGPPSDATEPPGEPPENEDENNPDNPDCQEGSIILCEPQVLGESVPIAGTNMSLEYRSDRVPGRTSSRRIRIPVTNDTPPDSLKRIVITVKVAGQKHKKVYEASEIEPNLLHFFEWNGKDIYGREVFGMMQAKINISYQYQGLFFSARPDLRRSFALTTIDPTNTEANIIGDRDTAEIKIERNYVKSVFNNNVAQKFNLAGWSLSPHHNLDIDSSLLSLGGGETINLNKKESGKYLRYSVCIVCYRESIVVEDDNHLLIVDNHTGKINRYDIRTNRYITIAGGGKSEADNIPALEADIDFPKVITTDQEGNIYTNDSHFGEGERLRKIDISNNTITTIAGSIDKTYASGDEGLAIDAGLSSIYDLKFDKQGNLYILSYKSIRKIDTNGIITTVWENRSSPSLYSMEIDDTGNIYVSSIYQIFRINTDGSTEVYAGTGEKGFEGDGGSALDAKFSSIQEIRLNSLGQLLVTDQSGKRIRKIGLDGIINTFIGGGSIYKKGLEVSLQRLRIRSVRSIDFDSEGNIYLLDYFGSIVQISSSQIITKGDNFIISKDGTQYFEFDSKGYHLATYDSLTNDVIYKFNYEDGLLTEIIDANDKKTTIGRVNGDISAIISPDGLRTDFEITDGYISKITNPQNQTTSMTYSNKGLMKTFTNAKNISSSFDYGRHGRLISDKAQFGNSWSLDRDIKSRGFDMKMKSELGRSTQHEIKINKNQDYVRKVTKPNGSTNKETILSNDTVRLEMSDGTISETQYSSDPRFGTTAKYPSRITVKTPSGLEQVISQTKSYKQKTDGTIFDLDSYTTEFYFNNKRTREYYDAEDRTITNTSPESRKTTLTLDTSHPRVLKRQRANLAAIHYSYNDDNKLISITEGSDAEARSSSFEYDEHGYLNQITNPLGQVIKFDRNKLGLIKSELSTGSLNYEFEFDDNNNPIGIKLPKDLDHEFDYNTGDLVSEYKAPDLANYSARNFQYSLDKELTKVTREDDSEINYSYNNKAQLTKITTIDGDYEFDYFNTSGKVKSLSTPQNNSLNFEYDGFLLSKEDMDGEVDHEIDFKYNNDFLISEIQVDEANPINYQYDKDNLLTQAGDLSLAYSSSSGLLNSTELGDIKDEYNYNSFAEPIQYESKYKSVASFKGTYTRDKLGRITQANEELNGQTRKFDYTYDSDNRLSSVLVNNIAVSSYEYDDNGNRVKVNGVSVAQYDNQDRLLSYGSNNYSYNPNGELVQKQNGSNTVKYSYDAFGNLKAVDLNTKTIDYLIDAKGRRIAKKVDNVLKQAFIYKDQLNPIAETDGQGNIVSRFVYGSKTNVPSYIIKDTKKYKVISDLKGSVRLVQDLDDGSIVQRIDYDEFGNLVLDTNPGFQPFAFAGGIYDQDTKLTLFGARNYDAETGRWISKDPILFNGKQGNLYVYVNNDPVNYLDPNGLEFSAGPILSGAATGFAEGAIVGGIIGFPEGGIGAIPGAIIGGLSGTVSGALIGGKAFGDSVASKAAAGAIGGVIGGPSGIVEGFATPIVKESISRAGKGLGETIDKVFGDQAPICK